MKSVLVLCFVVMVHRCQGQFDCFGEGPPRNPDAAAVAKGADDFALSLFTDIATSYPHNSIVLSPYSVWSVLNLAYFGAKGDTETQLQKALGVPGKGDSFYGSRIMEARLKLNEGTTFNKADKAYFAEDLVLKQCSLDKLTEIEKVNFNNAEAAAKKINQDISQATEGKVSNFLSAGIIARSRFILVNAVYFKGLWANQFSESATSVKPFYDETRRVNISEAKMMSTQAKLRYYDSEELMASVLELPYEKSNISMLLILPHVRKSTINTVLPKLTSNVLNEVTKNLTTKTVFVTMPRFKMTTRIADELKAGLNKLGVKDLFQPNLIDLTNFIVSEKVKVDDALHHATIEVSEEGTVAAAATGLIGTRSGVDRVIKFIADYPFIFQIRDVSQGLTLFMGVLRNPNHTTAF